MAEIKAKLILREKAHSFAVAAKTVTVTPDSVIVSIDLRSFFDSKEINASDGPSREDLDQLFSSDKTVSLHLPEPGEDTCVQVLVRVSSREYMAGQLVCELEKESANCHVLAQYCIDTGHTDPSKIERYFSGEFFQKPLLEKPLLLMKKAW